MADKRDLIMYVVYDGPSDYPDKFVVRRYVNGCEPHHSTGVALTRTIEGARKMIPTGLVCFPRSDSDDPVIVETWM